MKYFIRIITLIWFIILNKYINFNTYLFGLVSFMKIIFNKLKFQ